jgi:hypothetical protein
VTQKEKIVAFCKAHGSITVRDAVLMDINSPRKCISELRQTHDVTDVDETRVNGAGETKRYKRYFIKERVEDHGGQ